MKLKSYYFFYYFIFLGLFFYMNVSQASPKYFICGPDEDGCPKDGYQYCACIPYDYQNATSPYCLDFDKRTCVPLSQTTHCDPQSIFKDQGTCLATIFQSEPEPPCPMTTLKFCTTHHAYICDKDGHPENCHPSLDPTHNGA